LFLSEKWGPAIVPTAFISIALAVAALGFVPGVLYKAISRPDILNKLALVKMPIAVAILWYATRWGIVGVAAAQIVIGVISISMDMLVANHVMKYPFRELVNAITPSFTATMSMAVVLYLIRRLVPQADLLQLILMVVLGAATFFLVMWWMDRDALLQGLMTLRSTLNRKKAVMTTDRETPRLGARVSAVITAYNSEAYIAEAIKSILNQSRLVDEIVVVDDGSTDSTRRVVAEFAEQGIKFIQQHNEGAGAARNKGIHETSGEFIAFLDADDIWLEKKTELQLNYLLEHPQVALVSGFARWWNVLKDTVHNSGKVPHDMKTLRREILVHNVLGNPSIVMVRRTALAEAGLFNEKIRWGQDWELWQRLVQRYEAAVIPQPLTVYRWHGDNLSHQRGWERLSSYWHVSRAAIRKSEPAWRRPFLMARSWSNFTYRRAMYAIQSAFPRWKRIGYALAAFLVYPFEMTREKLGALVRSLLGDRIYRGGKRVLGVGMQTRGPE
jgi:glycosyltransferase involved in cell wall biosynthesis